MKKTNFEIQQKMMAQEEAQSRLAPQNIQSRLENKVNKMMKLGKLRHMHTMNPIC